MVVFGFENTQTAAANGDNRTLTLHHVHTGEDLTITYKRNGRYDADALKKIDWIMRDWRKNESIKMDPQAIDILWTVQQDIGNGKPIWIVCGYRSPGTNSMLRRRSSGVAENSQHTLGKAIDFYIPGASLEQTREMGLKLQRGGVGYYPTSGSPFVHMDVGSVRHWPRMSHDQLAKVFPDGRTVHIPSDGQPLKGYALALADIESRGTSMPSQISLASARSAGVNTAGLNTSAKPASNLLASIFSGKSKDEEEDDTAGVASDNSSGSSNNPASIAPVKREAARVLASAVPMVLPPVSSSAPAKVAATTLAAPVPGSSEKITPVKVAAIPMPPLRPARPAQQIALAAPADAGKTTLAAKTRNTVVAAAGASNVFSERGVWGDEGLKQVGAGNTFKVAFAEASGAVPMPSSISPSNIPLGYASVIANTPRPQQAANTPASSNPMIRPVQIVASVDFDDIWTRAIVMAPDMQNFMSATIMGTPDPKELRPLMRKPKSVLAMTFSDDPMTGMTTNRFSGEAVVFLDSVSFVTRTAMLAQ